jgi:glucosyl-dolichyl phosphate glucuronosyltransferase
LDDSVEMVALSVIIPTRNRALYLKRSLISITDQTFPADRYEIIVVDNGSIDDTKEVVDEINSQYAGRIRYVYEPTPGLHNGRHRGAKEANGVILLYGDDDIIASPEWVEEISKSFEDPDVGIAGGKILPEWEEDPPRWVLDFWSHGDLGRHLGYLSLIDLGEEKKVIPPGYTYGCNFAIRKKLLFACGGFHPDGMPQELIRYRGDGETALSSKISNRGYKILYNPKTSVKHIIPKSRMSEDYFCTRVFNQGISDSFTEIRKECNVFTMLQRILELSARIDEINTRIDEIKTRINEVTAEISECKHSAAHKTPKDLIRKLFGKVKGMRRYFIDMKLKRLLSSCLSKSNNLSADFFASYHQSFPDDFHRIIWDFFSENWQKDNMNEFVRLCVLPFHDSRNHIAEACFTEIKIILHSGDTFSIKEQLTKFFGIINMLNEESRREFISEFTSWVKSHLESEGASQVLEDNLFSNFISEDVNSLKLKRKLMLAWRKGKDYHREQVRNDEGLLRHVLRENYLAD